MQHTHGGFHLSKESCPHPQAASPEKYLSKQDKLGPKLHPLDLYYSIQDRADPIDFICKVAYKFLTAGCGVVIILFFWRDMY